MEIRLADRAAKLAEAGFQVFPAYGVVDGRCECGNPRCESPGKHPAVKGWREQASSDPRKVREWWYQHEGRNPAVATGNGLVVLDVDGKEGAETLRRLEEEYGALPPTPCVLTGRGKHFYFRWNSHLSNSTSRLGPKLDIRGDGGYVIGAGARHASGKEYDWKPGCSPEELPMAELPSWIPALLKANPAREETDSKKDGSSSILPEGKIPQGTRDSTLYRYGCYLRGVCGKDMEQIREELLRVNNEKCDPPMSDEQVRKLIHQVDKFERKGGAEDDFQDSEPGGLICAADVPDEDARFLLKPYLPEGQLTLVQGDPGEGKTAFACKLAALVTTGSDLLGLPCGMGNVLLLSVEDDMATLKKRFIASGGDVNRCFFVSNAAGLNFNSPEIERYIQEKEIKLVIFDPLQAFLGAKVDMNRANETRPVLAELKEMAKRNETAVVIICHINKAGKDGPAIQRALGSMDIPGACRSVIHIGRLENDQQKRLAVHVKSSNAREGQSILFSIVKDGGVDLEEFTEKGYENLSELNRKTRNLASNLFMLEEVVEACNRLLEKNPSGIKVRYKDMGIDWPTRVYPGKLMDALKDELKSRGIRIQTGEKCNGGAAVLITPAPAVVRGKMDFPEQLLMNVEPSSSFSPLSPS